MKLNPERFAPNRAMDRMSLQENEKEGTHRESIIKKERITLVPQVVDEFNRPGYGLTAPIDHTIHINEKTFLFHGSTFNFVQAGKT